MKTFTLIVSTLAFCMVPAAFAARPGAQILPVALDPPSGCDDSRGQGLNSADVLQVAAAAESCGDGHPHPALWTESTGMLDLGTIGAALGGVTVAVSDDGTAVGWQVDGTSVGLAFVRPLGGPAVELPKLAGMIYASANDISPAGNFIVGSNSTDASFAAVRWDRTGGDWQPVELPGVGVAGVSNDGRAVGSRSSGSNDERTAVSSMAPA